MPKPGHEPEAPSAPAPAAPSPAERCGLGRVSLPMALAAAPEDWRHAMALHGRPSWHTLTGVAYERAQALGIHPAVWAQAQDAIGHAGAALLVLIADAGSAERGGRIQNPGGWMRRMAERAERGQAHVHRSIFGLMHKEGDGNGL